LKQSFVNITIGLDGANETFSVHKELICHHSPFFNKAFNSQFREGLTQEMTIDDVEPETFGLLVAWLDPAKIEPMEHAIEIEASRRPGREALRFGKLWLLARRCIIPRLENQLADEIYATFDRGPSMSEYHPYYELAFAEAASELQNMAVSQFVRRLSKDVYDKTIENLPPAMILRVARFGHRLIEDRVWLTSMPARSGFHVSTSET
jgi:hypothetical protein